MDKETEQLIMEIKKEIELIDKAIEQADKTYTMTVTEDVIGLGKCYEGVYPKQKLWQTYSSLCDMKQTLKFTCQLITELSQKHESLIQKMLDGSKALCEENPDLVKGIVYTPKTNDEQIAEDFIENVWNKK